MPVSSRSTKAFATSTYSETTTRAGTSRLAGRAHRRRRAGSRAARSRCASAASPSASAASIIGSSLRWSRTTPPTTSRKNAASAGRYSSPSTSRPSQWLSNSARISFSGVAGDIHLVERLHGGKPRRAAAVGLASVVRCCRLRPCAYFLARWRLIAISASAARAASPPLSCSADAGPRPGLRLGVDGEDAVAAGQPVRDREVHQRARRLHRHDVEMKGLALDHAAERDHAVIGLLLLLGGVDRDGDGRRDFERARHRDDVPGAPWPRRAPWRRPPAAHRRYRYRSAPRR